jgi:hypothetical protein
MKNTNSMFVRFNWSEGDPQDLWWGKYSYSQFYPSGGYMVDLPPDFNSSIKTIEELQVSIHF